jgi:hypothetical protein
MSNNNERRYLSSLIHKTLGLGLGKERTTLLSLHIPSGTEITNNLFGNPKELSKAHQGDIAEIIDATSIKSDGSGENALERVINAKHQYLKLLTDQASEFLKFPRTRAMRLDQKLESKFRALTLHLNAMENEWNLLIKTAQFCVDNPTLPDIERVRYIYEASKVMAKEDLPGAEELRELAAILARRMSLHLPEQNGSLPRGVSGAAYSWAKHVFEEPLRSAAKEFEQFSPKRGSVESYPDFQKLAKWCKSASLDDNTSFERKIKNYAKGVIVDVLSKCSREEQAAHQVALTTFAKKIYEQATSIAAKHNQDMINVAALDIDSKESILAAVDAMVRIRGRCIDEFSKVAPAFLKTFRTFSERQPNPYPQFPEMVDLNYINHSLPEFKKVDQMVSIIGFIQESRAIISKVDEQKLSEQLARGLAAQPYLNRIGPDNSYRRLAETLINKVEHQQGQIDYPKTISWDGPSETGVIKSRLNDFEQIRGNLEHGIRGMIASSNYVGAKDYIGIIALIKQIETGAPEIGVHFRNAFVYAWNLPELVLELVHRPNETQTLFRATALLPEEVRRKSYSKSMELSP